MKKGFVQSRGLAMALLFWLASTMVVPFLFVEGSNFPLIEDLPIDVKERCFTLFETELENKFETSFTLASLPTAYICGIGVDASIIGDTKFNLECKLEIAGQVIRFDAPWDGTRVKELIWREVQKKMTGKKSTTQLTTKEINNILDTIYQAFANKGIEIDPFPSIETMMEKERLNNIDN